MNGPLQDEILKLEEQLGAPAVRSSVDLLAHLVSDEFVEYGSAGKIFTRQDVIEQMLAAPNVSIALLDFRVLAISSDVALATYRTGRSVRSSIWRREGQYWRIVFHQGTPITVPTPNA
jgi:hypothetical protein